MENKETLAEQIKKFQDAVDNLKITLYREFCIPILDFLVTKFNKIKK